MKRNKRAFTILELLVVIAIISILAIIAIPNFIGAIEKGREAREVAEINAVEKALSLYYIEHNEYPTLQGELFPEQPQPVPGSPHNIDFKKLYPKYLAKLPHFSYWWVTYEGEAIHTQSKLAIIEDDIITLTDEYSFKVYNGDGTELDTQPATNQVTLAEGQYIRLFNTKGTEILKLSKAYKGPVKHPQDKETDDDIIVEQPKNRAPVAIINVTPESDITTETSLVWDSSASSDPDGDEIVAVEWQGKQEIYNTPGTYTVELRVKDSKDLWSEWATKEITVAQANRKPVVAITMTPSTNVTTKTNIAWTYNTSTDPDGDLITAAEWQLDAGNITSNPNGVITTSGSHTMKLRVQDSRGKWSNWFEKQFNVVAETSEYFVSIYKGLVDHDWGTYLWMSYDGPNLTDAQISADVTSKVKSSGTYTLELNSEAVGKTMLLRVAWKGTIELLDASQTVLQSIPVSNATAEAQDLYINIQSGTKYIRFSHAPSSTLNVYGIEVTSDIDGQYEYNEYSAVPIMTSDSSPSGIASASNVNTYLVENNNTGYAYHAFDGIVDGNRRWASGLNGSQWLQYKFDTAKKIQKYAIASRSYSTSPEGSNPPKSWRLLGSNDGATWHTIDIRTNVTDWSTTTFDRREFEFNNSVSYTYYKLQIDQVLYDGKCTIAELELMTRK